MQNPCFDWPVLRPAHTVLFSRDQECEAKWIHLTQVLALISPKKMIALTTWIFHLHLFTCLLFTDKTEKAMTRSVILIMAAAAKMWRQLKLVVLVTVGFLVPVVMFPSCVVWLVTCCFCTYFIIPTCGHQWHFQGHAKTVTPPYFWIYMISPDIDLFKELGKDPFILNSELKIFTFKSICCNSFLALKGLLHNFVLINLIVSAMWGWKNHT